MIEQTFRIVLQRINGHVSLPKQLGQFNINTVDYILAKEGAVQRVPMKHGAKLCLRLISMESQFLHIAIALIA